MSDKLLTTTAILTTTCRQILCHRWLRFIHDQILMTYHEANLSVNEASIARCQGRGQILRGRGQKIWPWGRVGLEDLTSLLSTHKLHHTYMVNTDEYTMLLRQKTTTKICLRNPTFRVVNSW